MQDQEMTAPGLLPVDLRCEYLHNPLGIDTPYPRMSWRLVSDLPGQSQSAYRITAASSAAALAEGRPNLWDSGRVESSETIHIPYAGVSLTSGQRCWWQVQVWDQEGRDAGLSDVAWFEMGLLTPEDWQPAYWITGAYSDASPRLRRVFFLTRPVASARLYLCGQGVYEATLNGQPVSDQVLGPTVSYLAKRMLYDTFDVTDLLQAGENVIGVWLAPGYFGDPVIWSKMDFPADMHRFPHRPHVLRAALHVHYTDGSQETIGSDQFWRTHPSPLTPVRSHWWYCWGCSGEIYDGTDETPDWDRPDFDDSAWSHAEITDQPTAHLSARMNEPNRIRRITTPVGQQRVAPGQPHDVLLALINQYGAYNCGTTLSPGPGYYTDLQRVYAANLSMCGDRCLGGWVYDLGRHISGWVELQVTGQCGDWVCLFGLDCHRLRGQLGETVRLHFAHRVVRYVPVLFFGEGPEPEIISIRGLDISNDVASSGHFACSDPELTEIATVVKRTTEALLLNGMLMDSWQGRFGTFLPSEAALYAWDFGALCGKLTTDIRDQQRPDGWCAMFGAPISLDNTRLKEAMVQLPWLAYLYYGDRDILRRNYDAIRRYTEVILPVHDLTARTWQPPQWGYGEFLYGDHGRPTARWYDPHTGDLYETMVMAGYFRTLESIAHVLGETEDAERYHNVQARLVDKCNRPEFLDRETGRYDGIDQGCHAHAVVQEIAPAELQAKVADQLLRDIMDTRLGHVDTGYGGTEALLKALIRLNRPDVGRCILVNATPPSLCTMLNHPQTPERLTILPEFFSGGMIPNIGLSTVGFWFYQALGGICPDPAHPGFQRFIIRPQLAPTLTWVEAEYRSVRGPIRSCWQCEGHHLLLEVSVPANTQALVYVPGEDAQMQSPVDGVSVLGAVEPTGETLFEVPGGQYTFTARLPDRHPRS
jgi:alpha-L-rhamnosidase